MNHGTVSLVMMEIHMQTYCLTHFLITIYGYFILEVVDNGDYFKVNSEICNINTRNKLNLHLPISNLSVYQKGTYYSGIKVFSSLPLQIKDLSHNRNQLKCALKNFLYFHSFYILNEYFSCNICVCYAVTCVNYFLGRKYCIF